MKRFLLVLSSILLLQLFSTSVQAQLLNRLKNKAKNAAMDRVEEKIDQKIRQVAFRSVDKTWESVFGESSEELEEGSAPPDLPFKLNANVETEDAYHFQSESVMEILYTEDGNTEQMLMNMYMSEEGNYSATTFSGDEIEQGQEPTMIYDFGNEAMIMLMNTEEGPFSFAYDWAQEDPVEMTEGDQDMEEMENPYSELESLGTKNILGYECEGYRSETDDTMTEYWITKEKVDGLEQVLHANSSTRFFSGGATGERGYGTLMESVSKDKESGDRTEMRMIQLTKRVDLSFVMEEYPLILNQ